MLEHVVVVTDSLSIDGGSAKVALGSALALARSGLPVTVFAAAGEADSELRACTNVRIVSTGQGDALSSPSRLGGALQGLWNLQAYARMSELLATLDPMHTVVHVHGWTKALSSSVIASIVRAQFPVVVTLHEYFAACPTGCLYLHRDGRVCDLTPMSIACVRKNCDSRNYAFKLYRVLRQLIQRTVGAVPRRITNYITVSGFSRRVMEPLLPAGSRFHSVDNPVDAERAERVPAETNRPFVFVGRMSAEKGAHLLAAAARRAGVPVVFVGDGPDRAGIASRFPEVKCTGWLDRSGVAAQLRAARCVVVPSLWYETLGLAVLEAAALGIPAIVADGTAASDLVVSGTSGLTFERGSADALAEQLRACDDGAFVERLSRGAYDAFWSRPPTMQAHVDRLLATYDTVMHARAPQAGAVRFA